MKKRHLFLSLILLPLSLQAGLEGGLITKGRHWSGALVLPMNRPADEERAKELEQRKKDMATQAEALKERLKRVPNDATMAKFKARMEEIKANAGWVPEIQHVFGLKDMQNMLNNDSVLDSGLLAGYKQFQEDLKKRGVDLIVVPFPANSHFYAHQVVDGLNAEDEYYPGYAKMMLEFLENDIEVIDCMDEFRKATENPMPVHFPNDPHTASPGRKIMAQAFAKRLQRYDFARKRSEKKFPYKTIEWKGARTDWGQFLLNARIMGDNRKDVLKSSNIPQETMPALKARPMSALRVLWPNADPNHKNKNKHFGSADIASEGFEDLVLVGDSQLHSAVFGSGLPEIIHAEIGGVCRWGSKSWSGFSLPEIYLETVPNVAAAQPRVVAVFHLFFKLPASEKSTYKPKALPELGGTLAGDLAKEPFNARVKVTKFSKPKDPKTVDYKEALMVAEAQIIEGPLAGQTIGIRHEVMNEGKLSKSFEKGRHPNIIDKVYNMRLVPWELAVKNEPKLGTVMVYDDIDLDLTAPIFWPEQGPLNRKRMRAR